jgi:glucose-1-phosphate thymidylyltransferase
MKTLILAAGYATRLYPLTKDTPKPLLELNGRPILDYILEKVEAIKEIDEIIIVTNNRFYSQFSDYLSVRHGLNPYKYKLINDGSNTTDDKLGAIGDIELAIKTEKLRDDLLIVAGDNLFDFDLREFICFSKEKHPSHSICLYLPQNHLDLTRFGIVVLDKFSEIIGFEEKPEFPKSNLLSTCIYYFPSEKLPLVNKYISQKHNVDTPGSYIRWLAQNDQVFGKIFSGTWFDLGDFDSLSDAVIHLNNKNHKIKGPVPAGDCP